MVRSSPTAKQRRRLTLAAASLVVFSSACAGASRAQEPISLTHFDGHETWPLYAPGDLSLDNAAVSQLRIAYDAEFPAPPNAELGPSESLSLVAYIDVTDVVFAGRQADWIQWTFSGAGPEAEGFANLDLLIHDQETQQLLYRLVPSSPGADWGGSYNVIQARPDGVRQIMLDAEGASEVAETPLDQPVFDFASFGFLFPFMELREGLGVRLRGYHYPTRTVQSYAAFVTGRAQVQDALGRDHDVWAVDVMPESQRFLTTFYVSEEAPFFFGWRYRQVADGSTLFGLGFRGWTSTSVSGAERR